MPPKPVSSDTFNALHIAQATINYVHNALLYGAANQAADLLKQYGPDGVTPTNGMTIPRLQASRTAVDAIVAQPHLQMPTMPDSFYPVGVIAGVSAFYRAGNCGENAALAFCYLAQLGFPGLAISYCSSKLMDHAFVMIESSVHEPTLNIPQPVICDPWPTNAQAVLWEDHFCNGAYDTITTWTITDDDMGNDAMAEAFKASDPDAIKAAQPASLVAGWTSERITTYVNLFLGQGLYNQQATTATGAFQDYTFSTLSLLTVLGAHEQWTARLQPVLTETIDVIGPKVGLDPSLVYRTS